MRLTAASARQRGPWSAASTSLAAQLR